MFLWLLEHSLLFLMSFTAQVGLVEVKRVPLYREEVPHLHHCTELEEDTVKEDTEHQVEVVEEHMMVEETKRKKKREETDVLEVTGVHS